MGLIVASAISRIEYLFKIDSENKLPFCLVLILLFQNIGMRFPDGSFGPEHFIFRSLSACRGHSYGEAWLCWLLYMNHDTLHLYPIHSCIATYIGPVSVRPCRWIDHLRAPKTLLLSCASEVLLLMLLVLLRICKHSFKRVC